MRLLDPRTILAAVAALALLLPASLAFAQPNTGSADFSRYVSVGDSLTAGFMSGSLHQDAQRFSYPALIHRQATGGAGGFEQPLVSAPGIPPILELRSLAPLAITPAAGVGAPLNLNLPQPYNNLAVPGAEIDDAVNTVTDGGGLHDLILRGLGTQWQQALALQPTFVSIWIGNNDALAAATTGMVIEGVTLTSLADFELDLRNLMGALASSPGLTGMAIATIPDVTAIPFVTTIPPVVVDPATSQPVIVGGQPIPLIGPDGPLSPADFVLLPASALLAQGIGIPQAIGGTGQPLPDNAVLSAAEAATINDRVAGFNNLIRAQAQEVGNTAVVDINRIFGDIRANGTEVAGIDLTTEFLRGGLFSFDGVHATQLGYAIVANAFIDEINHDFGASIPEAGLGQFLFTGDGQAPGGGGGTAAGEFVFTKRAFKNLRFALGIPKIKKLRRLKRQAEANGGVIDTRRVRSPQRNVVRSNRVRTSRVRTSTVHDR